MSVKRVLALASSPRIGGNTDRLLDSFLEGLLPGNREVEKIYLCRLDINPCLHCGGCLPQGRCVLEDDMETIYRGLAEADVLVFASPVFFGTVSAQAKTVIDRCQALWVAKVKLGKPIHPVLRPGCFISAAGQDIPGIFDCSLKVVKIFFNTAQFRLAASVLEPGLDESGDLDRETERLDRARDRGLSLSEELTSS